jgi:ABC-type Fe3+ transport system permease subunit
MKRPEATSLGGVALLFLLLGLGAAAPARLLWLALQPAHDGPSAIADAQAAGLFLRSVVIAAGATTVAVGLGGACGIVAARVAQRLAPPVLTLFFVTFCVSPYLLALGWLGGDIGSPTGRWLLGHEWAVAWVLGTALAPLACLLVYYGARRLAFDREAAIFLLAPRRPALYALALGGLLPTLAAAAVVVFGLALSDYAVASLYQVPTYPVEIFLAYAGVFRPQAAARACLPLVATGVIVAAAAASFAPRVWLGRAGAAGTSRWPLTRNQARATAGAAAGVALVALAPPWFGMLAPMQLPVAFRAILGGGWSATVNSIAVSSLAALVALGLAWPAARVVAKLEGRLFIACATVLLIPLFVPASAYGIGWVEFGTAAGGMVTALGHLGPGLCLASRFGGTAALVLAAVQRQLPRESCEAAVLYQPRAWRRWVGIEMPFVGPAAAASGTVIFALSMNATGILVLTMTPGAELLPLRIDNLLHYGLPEEASALATLAALIAALPALLAASFAAARSRR